MVIKKILIIDDHADTRFLVSARLKKHGYDTVFAADALQAVAVARQVQPDAILLDLRLPGGNGFLVLERLKAITPLSDIPVVVMTADQSPGSELKALAAGASGYLHKPVEEETLLSVLRGVTGCAPELSTLDVGQHG